MEKKERKKIRPLTFSPPVHIDKQQMLLRYSKNISLSILNAQRAWEMGQKALALVSITLAVKQHPNAAILRNLLVVMEKNIEFRL